MGFFSVVPFILSFALSISHVPISPPSINKRIRNQCIRENPHWRRSTRNLLTHGIQSSLQIPLQALRALSICLLRSWVLSTPAPTSLRDRNGWALVLALLAGLDSHMLSESGNFLQNHLSHLAHVLHDLEVEVEGGRATRLVRGVVPDLEIWVFQSLLDRDTRGWVKRKHVVQEVESIGVGVGEEAGERSLSHEWQIPHIFLGSGRSDAGECLFVGCAEDVKNLVELINVISALEEWSSTKQLRENAAN
jgi:hypothetical protein